MYHKFGNSQTKSQSHRKIARRWWCPCRANWIKSS